ncbi:glycosyltransferase family 39 protein, partial [Cesiribacter andamanensis]|uniref:glycosyltransferase family 39 protein n=1 Tax=Cesiribacter andamanensis TaxID=649507 RepID=UPI0006867209
MQAVLRPGQRRATLSQNNSLILGMGLALFLFQLLANVADGYGIFRDEFYYLACSQRLAWGYVDHPPLSVFLLALQSSLLGDSLVALRVLPALFLAGTVLLSGAMVQQLGGGWRAILLAGVAVMGAPIMLAMGSFYSMNSLDIFLWAAVAYQLIRLIQAPSPGKWLLLGVLLGLGLLNKVGFLWLGAGLAVGILLSPLRQQLRTPYPYLAAALSMLIFLPFVLWNAAHDFPHLEFMHNAVTYKYAGITRADFLGGLLLQLNPLAVLIWLPGLYYLLVHPLGRQYRLLGVVFLVVFLILLLNGRSKSEYLAPAFPMLLAAGAVWLEARLRKGRGRMLYWALVGGIALSSLLLAPLARPLLPVPTYIAYTSTLGVSQANAEGKALKELPQFYADRFGWQELAQEVAGVYKALSAEEQALTSVFTQNYGEAGALEYYADTYSLPPAISGHN